MSSSYSTDNSMALNSNSEYHQTQIHRRVCNTCLVAGLHLMQMESTIRTCKAPLDRASCPDIIHANTPSTLPNPSELFRCSYSILSRRAVSLHQKTCSGLPFVLLEENSRTCPLSAWSRNSCMAVCIAGDASVEECSIGLPPFLLPCIEPSYELFSDSAVKSIRYPLVCTAYLSPIRKEHLSTVSGLKWQMGR